MRSACWESVDAAVPFKNLNLLDPRWNEARGGYEVLVEGDTIKEVSDKPIKAADARRSSIAAGAP